MSDTSARSRRDRWAARENAKRAAAYEVAVAAWRTDADELAHMTRTAQDYHGRPTGSVVLKRGESAYFELPAVSLVEVQRGPGQYVGGYSGFSFRIAKGIRYSVGASRGSYVPGPEQHKVTDQGAVTITNRRVILQGSRNSREWAFSKMLGVQHDASRPFTLMHVSNRQKVSGLLYDASQATAFRFYVSLALADFQDSREAFLAQLRDEQQQHERIKPAEPRLVGPDDAPSGVMGALGALRTLCFGRPGWPRGWRVLQGFATVLVTLLVIGALSGGNGQQPVSSATGRTIDATPAAGATSSSAAQPPVSSPSSAASPQAVVTSRPARTARPTPSRPRSPRPAPVRTTAPRPTVKPTPTPTPKPTHAVPSTCGAPKNPWGYNFCGSGSLIYHPAPDVCGYFDCIDYFDNGVGYMIECSDGTYSMSGGRSGRCSHHGGELREVYSGSGPH
ncbi:MAG: hypothetical protein ACJ74O_02000 [Frankiaceae bacterium]